MTVITPTQRQLIFTTSFDEEFGRPRSSELRKTLKRFNQGKLSVQDAVCLVVPIVCIAGVAALLLGGVSSVILSYHVNRLSTEIEQQKRINESLGVSQAEFLSPEARSAYASMIQLNSPAHTHYVSNTVDQLAAQETLVALP